MINIGEVLLNLWESSGFSFIFGNFMRSPQMIMTSADTPMTHTGTRPDVAL